MIKTFEILPGITLRCFPDDRFRQGCLSVQLVRPMNEEEAAMNALLPSVLLQGTRHYPDLRAITRHLEGLYGTGISPMVRRVGDCQVTGIYCGFMDDRFALPGDQVLLPVLEFVRELLTEPLTRGDSFLPDIVEREKTNLISLIQSEKNDKAVYAMNRLLRAMCRGDSFGIPRLGDVPMVEAVDGKKLYRHYREILKTSPVELFYAGSMAAETLIPALERIFGDIPRAPEPMPAQTPLRVSGGGELTETMEVSQGKLCMGFVTPVTNRSEEFAAMQVMNTLFGGGMTSRLFVNVREKLSLCYAVSSSYYSMKGIVTVSAGVDFDKEPATRQEILRQLDAVCRGDFTKQELEAARQSLLSGLRGVEDSPGSIEGYYATAGISGIRRTAGEHADAIRAVTAQQVAEAANTLRLHTTYFLKGESL